MIQQDFIRLDERCQAIRYAPYSKIEPLLKKWLKSQNINKCFEDGYY